MKRVNALAIHDLSCVSKSSLTVVMPILEALGVECAVLPTELLATQTDGFDNVYSLSLKQDMERILASFSSLSLSFDGICTGYMGSLGQIDIALEAFNRFPGLRFVDPVMGDQLALYPALSGDIVNGIRELIGRADIIKPNYTEALFLTGESETMDYKRLISSLQSLGPRRGVITSFPLELGDVNIAYDNDEVRLFSYDLYDVSYPGTGDLFSSIVFALNLKGMSFFTSIKLATEISTECVRCSLADKRERRMGIELYPAFAEFRRMVL